MAPSVALAADHGGITLKNELLPWIQSRGYAVTDLGAATFDSSDDYPDFAEAVGRAIISRKAERGILVCGSGVGACIAANKLPGIRACLCHDVYSAHQGVEHDDMNVLCLGGRVIGPELAKDLVDAFLRASFGGEERHRRRLAKVLELERKATTKSNIKNQNEK
ncbi:MAG: ribose 5-phosphate isomerase B [Chloroflexi bacterium]|nr:ribose 5-phosphate isomerase B [Chloroflexota bacterium]